LRPLVINLVGDGDGGDGEEDAWNAVDEIEGCIGLKEKRKS